MTSPRAGSMAKLSFIVHDLGFILLFDPPGPAAEGGPSNRSSLPPTGRGGGYLLALHNKTLVAC